MTFTIANGTQVDIQVGSQIKAVPGYLPAQFNGQWLPVMAVDESGPFVALEEYTPDPNPEAGINPLSCVSPQIIGAVL